MRATLRQNQQDLAVVNRQLGLPEGYVKGALHVDTAYGGQKIVQYVSDGGSTKEITRGYQPAGVIASVIEGMSAALDLAEKQGFVAPTPPEGGR